MGMKNPGFETPEECLQRLHHMTSSPLTGSFKFQILGPTTGKDWRPRVESSPYGIIRRLVPATESYNPTM